MYHDLAKYFPVIFHHILSAIPGATIHTSFPSSWGSSAGSCKQNGFGSGQGDDGEGGDLDCDDCGQGDDDDGGGGEGGDLDHDGGMVINMMIVSKVMMVRVMIKMMTKVKKVRGVFVDRRKAAVYLCEMRKH